MAMATLLMSIPRFTDFGPYLWEGRVLPRDQHQFKKNRNLGDNLGANALYLDLYIMMSMTCNETLSWLTNSGRKSESFKIGETSNRRMGFQLAIKDTKTFRSNAKFLYASGKRHNLNLRTWSLGPNDFPRTLKPQFLGFALHFFRPAKHKAAACSNGFAIFNRAQIEQALC